jgi:hypothetical protein
MADPLLSPGYRLTPQCPSQPQKSERAQLTDVQPSDRTGKPPKTLNMNRSTPNHITNSDLFRSSQPGRDATSPCKEHRLMGRQCPLYMDRLPRSLQLGRRPPDPVHRCNPGLYSRRPTSIILEKTPPIRRHPQVQVRASPPPERAETPPSVRLPVTEGGITVMAPRPTIDTQTDRPVAYPPKTKTA